MISEETVDDTLAELIRLTGDAADEYMRQLGARQMEVLTFVTTMTEELSESAEETAILAAVALCGMFERAYGRQLPPIDSATVVAAYEKLFDEMERLVGDEHGLEHHAHSALAIEPFAMQYITGVLSEWEHPEDALTGEEIGDVFLVLRTVLNVLHDAMERTTAP